MQSSTITVVINGQPYKLSASDKASLAQLSDADRQTLLTLLEAISNTPTDITPSDFSVEKLVAIDEVPTLTGTETSTQRSDNDPLTDARKRLSEVEVDAMFAQLAAEERLNNQPLTLAGLMKFIVIVAALIVILILVF